MRALGWFEAPGIKGERTLDEQLLGLEPLFSRIAGKTVTDLGCAEGLIALECMRHGARRAVGYDNNAVFVDRARQRVTVPGIAFFERDLNQPLDEEDRAIAWAQIVLGLAVFHKLHRPETALREWASLCGELMVIRLPIHGADGVIRSKFYRSRECNINRVMPECGFRLWRTEPGPRGEPVQYWERVAA